VFNPQLDKQLRGSHKKNSNIKEGRRPRRTGKKGKEPTEEGLTKPKNGNSTAGFPREETLC